MWEVPAACLVCSGLHRVVRCPGRRFFGPWCRLRGYTAGSMSRLTRRRERSQLLLVGDLTMGPSCSVGDRVPGVGVRSQLVETTRKVLVLKRPMPDLVSCRRTIRPPPSGCWRAEAGGSK
jgi:hypothetical protein